MTHPRQDHFARRAKKEGHPARSIYKLEEIDARWQLLRRNMRVLELGAAPGSWTQYAAERVGPGGGVVALDLQPLRVALPPHVQFAVCDVFTVGTGEGPFGAAGALGTFDCILSDMAPATMGDHKTDALRSAGLCEHAIHLSDTLARGGGHLVLKVLEGGEVPLLVQQMRQRYTKVERLRPQATRRQSTEIFLVGLSRRTATKGTT